MPECRAENKNQSKLVLDSILWCVISKGQGAECKSDQISKPSGLSSFGISISFLTPRGIAGVSSLTLVNSAVLSRASPVLDGTSQSALSSPGLLSLLPLYVEKYSLEGQPRVDVTAPAKGSAQFPPCGSETKQPWRVLPRLCAGSQEQMNSRSE